MARRRYTIAYKIQVVQEIIAATTRDENPMSIRMASSIYNISASMFRNWKKKNDAHLSYRPEATRMRPGTRQKSSIMDVEDELVQWLIHQRECGNYINHEMVVMKLGELDDVFRNKTDNAKNLILRRLARRKQIYIPI
jgi:transposase-like protein